IQPFAMFVKRRAIRIRINHQGIEPVYRELGQAIRSSDNGAVQQTCPNHTRAKHNGIGSRGAGRTDGSHVIPYPIPLRNLLSEMPTRMRRDEMSMGGGFQIVVVIAFSRVHSTDGGGRYE